MTFMNKFDTIIVNDKLEEAFREAEKKSEGFFKNNATMNYFTSKTAEQLTLVSISHAREGKAGELKKPVSTSSKKTRQEEGAISYHLYEDREDPCQFIFHEIWANEELWKKHTQSEHLQAFSGPQRRTDRPKTGFTTLGTFEARIP